MDHGTFYRVQSYSSWAFKLLIELEWEIEALRLAGGWAASHQFRQEYVEPTADRQSITY